MMADNLGNSFVFNKGNIKQFKAGEKYLRNGFITFCYACVAVAELTAL